MFFGKILMSLRPSIFGSIGSWSDSGSESLSESNIAIFGMMQVSEDVVVDVREVRVGEVVVVVLTKFKGFVW